MEREGRDGFVVFLLFYRSFWAPKGAKDQITKETDPFDDFGFKSFVDRFLEAMSLRVSWLAFCR